METTRSGPGIRCNIRRVGDPGSYAHSVAPQLANRPVSHVSFWDDCRFCN